jgi:hypothetical protein
VARQSGTAVESTTIRNAIRTAKERTVASCAETPKTRLLTHRDAAQLPASPTATQFNVPTDSGTGVLPPRTRDLFIDHRNSRSTRLILIGQSASGYERNAHGPEVRRVSILTIATGISCRLGTGLSTTEYHSSPQSPAAEGSSLRRPIRLPAARGALFQGAHRSREWNLRFCKVRAAIAARVQANSSARIRDSVSRRPTDSAAESPK